MSAAHLPRDKRLALAQVAGTISRLSVSDEPFELGLAELLTVSRDPEVLGYELGSRLGAEHPTPADAVAVRLLRAAGADEEVAAVQAEWQRERVRNRGAGPGLS